MPTLIHLSCADVFNATGDAQTSRAALKIGHQELIESAYRIADPVWRDAFLENIPEHREMLRRWSLERSRPDL